MTRRALSATLMTTAPWASTGEQARVFERGVRRSASSALRDGQLDSWQTYRLEGDHERLLVGLVERLNLADEKLVARRHLDPVSPELGQSR
jgi:hypothetical protein